MTVTEKRQAIIDFCRGTSCDVEGCPLFCTDYSNEGICYRTYDTDVEIEEMYKIIFGKSEEDPVERPSHYTNGAVECIDAIAASMTPTEYVGFLKGQVIKYVWRYKLKGKPVEDLKKARYYLERLIAATEEATV